MFSKEFSEELMKQIIALSEEDLKELQELVDNGCHSLASGVSHLENSKD